MVKVKWLRTIDPSTGHAFTVWNGVMFTPDQWIAIDDEQLIRMIRYDSEHGDRQFAIEEASNGKAQGEEGKQDEQEKQKDQSKVTGYAPIKKEKPKKKNPDPIDSLHRPAADP